MAVVDLERVSYQVTEGGTVVVCAFVRTPNITCPIDFAFELSLSVRNGMMMKIFAFGMLLLMARVCVYIIYQVIC